MSFGFNMSEGECNCSALEECFITKDTRVETANVGYDSHHVSSNANVYQ
jgi:hypothetical protein